MSAQQGQQQESKLYNLVSVVIFHQYSHRSGGDGSFQEHSSASSGKIKPDLSKLLLDC